MPGRPGDTERELGNELREPGDSVLGSMTRQGTSRADAIGQPATPARRPEPVDTAAAGYGWPQEDQRMCDPRLGRLADAGRTKPFGRKENVMRAGGGYRLIVESPTSGEPRRDGEIVAVHHADGSPPYDVRRSDGGRTTLVFSGPGAHVHHFAPADHARSPR
ncbi:hypothetical protein GCM10010430_56610 [Kitasatospora cystarginea]|uniref:DUF1918 domain-containing protein n=1 Tax=Kitasatospora cystarginea TaxID=58350 RepID=A0ABP5RK25_9ACTN